MLQPGWRVWKVLRVAAENRKNESNNKNTRRFIENAIHSLPAGGAFGAAETAVSPVTAVIKAELRS